MSSSHSSVSSAKLPPSSAPSSTAVGSIGDERVAIVTVILVIVAGTIVTTFALMSNRCRGGG